MINKELEQDSLPIEDLQKVEILAEMEKTKEASLEAKKLREAVLIKKNEIKISTAHDDYDWKTGKIDRKVYNETEKINLTNSYNKTFKTINEHEIVTGIVGVITGTDVLLDVGFKSDGLVSISEFRDMPNLQAGDQVEVYVLEKENSKGQLSLSRKNAKLMRAWEAINRAYENVEIVTGTVLSKTKGGLIVDVYGLETFLPGSQIDVRPVTDYDMYVGKTMEFKVVKINDVIKNAVISHKALIESDLQEQRQRIIAGLEKGQILEGTVKNITDFGAFIDLGGVDGLLYITDISWGRISHPSEVLTLGQKLNVAVIDFDNDKRRISLGLKQLTPHPWEVLGETISEGTVISGKVVNIEDYGAFVEIKPGVEGLIHVSEVTWANQPVSARDYFKLGSEIEAKVVTLDRDDRKMSLSIKQLRQDPWTEIEERYPIGSRHEGEVKNITPYGVFVELSEGIGGMVHISDLSWTKRFTHPAEYTKNGNKLEVTILGIDKDARKLSLGHKQIEEDPWEAFETVFTVGSVHNGTLLRKDDKGAVIQLPYGLEAFASPKHLRKEDGNIAEVDETLPFKVIEFDRNEKKIIISHYEIVREKKGIEEKEAAAEADRLVIEEQETLTAVNENVEQSTLGDLEALGKLKEQMEDKIED